MRKVADLSKQNFNPPLTVCNITSPQRAGWASRLTDSEVTFVNLIVQANILVSEKSTCSKRLNVYGCDYIEPDIRLLRFKFIFSVVFSEGVHGVLFLFKLMVFGNA